MRKPLEYVRIHCHFPHSISLEIPKSLIDSHNPHWQRYFEMKTIAYVLAGLAAGQYSQDEALIWANVATAAYCGCFFFSLTFQHLSVLFSRKSFQGEQFSTFSLSL